MKMKQYAMWALVALFAITMSASHAAMTIDPGWSQNQITPLAAFNSAQETNMLLPLGGINPLYASVKVTNGGLPFIIDLASFSIARSGVPFAGPISYETGTYPGTLPIYTAWDQFNNPINFNGQPVANGALIYAFTGANFQVPDPSVDTLGEMSIFTANFTFHEPASAPVSGSAAATATVVPEPGALALATMASVGLIAIRRRRR